MSTDNYCGITKEKLEIYLSELGKLINKKKAKGFYSELVIVGGASILLNYGFRTMSYDIDCTDSSGILMNDVVNEVAEKYDLPSNWINTDFVQTKSYSNKLSQYSQYYKSYGHGALIVRTIKDEYLIAMKAVSARKYKNDYPDILGIINECQDSGKAMTFELIKKAIINLYDSFDVVSDEMLKYLKSILESNATIDQQIDNKKESVLKIVEKR